MKVRASQRESAYRWFGELDPAGRLEFLCGLLDLLNPLELRFAAACLEELARKDQHSLRDAEIRANSATELLHGGAEAGDAASARPDLGDAAVRGRLLVSLALLRSDNREAANALYRTLGPPWDPCGNGAAQPGQAGQVGVEAQGRATPRLVMLLPSRTTMASGEAGARGGQELLLLYTMASNHPAFAFHHKQAFRLTLRELRRVLRQARRGDRENSRKSDPDGEGVCVDREDHSSDGGPEGLDRLLYQATPCLTRNTVSTLLDYGKPKMDGDLKVLQVGRAKQERYVFLFDKAALMCKKKGDNFELKHALELASYKITNDPTSNKDSRKWSHSFYLTPLMTGEGYQFFCKTEELKRKWIKNFEMALSNLHPGAYQHEFHMYTFERAAECHVCHMLLKGTYYQGYQCQKCGAEAHKECLDKIVQCQRPLPPSPGQTPSDLTSSPFSKSNALMKQRSLPSGIKLQGVAVGRAAAGLPHVQAVQAYPGAPLPPLKLQPTLTLACGEVVELTRAEPDSAWWEGRSLVSQQVGFFPRDFVKPVVNRPTEPSKSEFNYYAWFVGTMDREQANQQLRKRNNGTYLIRERPDGPGEYAISIRFNNEVKHIKIIIKEGYHHITEHRRFRSLVELIEYYQAHSLKEGFRALDTTLQFHERDRSVLRGNSTNSVFSPRMVGTAVARYSFSARDMRELSLSQGDVVKIYSKSGANQGWWRGEVDGRVGWFPSTYVDEEGV